MRHILMLCLLGLALTASMTYHSNVQKVRRAMQNTVSFDASTDEGIPPFNPNDFEGWEEMTAEEQEQVEEIYHQFEKLAHIMEDWATEFEQDMAKYDNDEPVPVNPDTGYRGDTGARGATGWRRSRSLQTGTDGTSANHSPATGNYVPVGANPYPEDPKKKTVMDDSTDDSRAPQNPPVPTPKKEEPQEIDLTDAVKIAPPVPEPVEEKPAPLRFAPVPAPAPEEPKPEFIKINAVPEEPKKEEPAAPAPAPAPAPTPIPVLKPVTHAPHQIATKPAPVHRPTPIKFAGAAPAPRPAPVKFAPSGPRAPEIVHIAESVPGYSPFTNIPQQSNVGLRLKRNRN